MGLFSLGGNPSAFSPIVNSASRGASTASQPFQTGANTVNSTVLPSDASMIAKGGTLSPYMQAALDKQRRVNATDTTASTEAALRKNAYLGRGGPSGFNSSVMNTANRARQEADTNAYEDAMTKQAGLNLQAGGQIGDLSTGFGRLQNEFNQTQLQAEQAKQAARARGLSAGLGLLSSGMSFFGGGAI